MHNNLFLIPNFNAHKVLWLFSIQLHEEDVSLFYSDFWDSSIKLSDILNDYIKLKEIKNNTLHTIYWINNADNFKWMNECTI